MSVREMIAVDVVEEIIARVQATKNLELASNPNKSSDQIFTQKDVADAVDRALQEVSQALRKTLDFDDQDEQNSWWHSYFPDQPSDFFRGGLTEEGLLPRTRSAGSWWNDSEK